MRFRLRTLLIALTIGPLVLALAWNHIDRLLNRPPKIKTGIGGIGPPIEQARSIPITEED